MEKSPSQRSGILIWEGNRGVGNEPVATTFQKYWNQPLCKEWISKDCALRQCLPPQSVSGFTCVFTFLPQDAQKKSKTLSLKACQLYLSILVIRNLEFRETWEQSWSNEFSPIPSMQNLVCFINVIQGKCSKDWILPNQMWRWSVGVCFKKSTSHGESSPAGLPNT